MTSKSAVFSAYNRARAAARKGLLDPKKVNRALGVLQHGEWKYQTTLKACTCPDFQRNHTACKHMIAKMINFRAAEQKPAQAAPAPAVQDVKEIRFTTSLLSPELHLTEDGTVLDRPMIRTDQGWQHTTADEIINLVAFEHYRPTYCKQISNSGGKGRWTQFVIVTLEK